MEVVELFEEEETFIVTEKRLNKERESDINHCKEVQQML